MNDLLTDSTSWALILGVLTPLIVAVVQQPKWTPKVRALVGLAAAVVIGFVSVLASGDLDDTQSLLGVIALVFVASSSAYKALWKPTGVARAIETTTSPGSTRAGSPGDNDGHGGRSVGT